MKNVQHWDYLIGESGWQRCLEGFTGTRAQTTTEEDIMELTNNEKPDSKHQPPTGGEQ